MKTNVISVDKDTEITTFVAFPSSRRGKLVGVVSRRDIIKYMMEPT